MGHILTVLFKIAGFTLLGLLLTATAAVALFQLSDTYKAHALNVRIEVKGDPAGIVQIVNRTGELPPGIASSAGNAFTPSTINSGGDSDTEPTGDNEEGDPEGTPPGDTGSTPPPEGPAATSASPPSIPPGIEKQIKGGGGVPPGLLGTKGSQPTTLTINTDITFGTVFPGEKDLQKEFIVYLTETENPPRVEYHLIVSGNLTSYLTWERDPDETDAEPDDPDQVSGSSLGGDLQNNGGKDISDRWLVTLDLTNLPDNAPRGDYGTIITVWVDVPTVKPEPPPTQVP